MNIIFERLKSLTAAERKAVIQGMSIEELRVHHDMLLRELADIVE